MSPRDLPENWRFAPLGDLVTTVSVRGHQAKTDAYDGKGQWPIVDQGQSKIVGYTNEVEPIRGPFPLVVFGDHTRIVKPRRFT